MVTVLIIDNDDDQLTALKLLLQSNNYNVIASSRVPSIFKLITKFHPDIVLIDNNVGYFDSSDICLEIKNNYLSGNLKVIVYSGDAAYRRDTCSFDGLIEKHTAAKTFLNELRRYAYPGEKVA